MKGWQDYKFNEFVEINPTIAFDRQKEYPFIEMKDVDGINKFCQSHQKRLFSGAPRFYNNDTLFARITPCLENGKIAKVRNLDGCVGFGSTEFLVFHSRDNLSCEDFIYYLARWGEVRDFAEKNMEGTSGRQRVNKEAFSSLKLKLPPLPEQRAIASVLSSLDDKIDLLQRQNATLEAMAEALFKQWFVVEAKEEWEYHRLSYFGNIVCGKTPSKINKYYFDGEIPFIKIPDMHSKIFIDNTTDTLSLLGADLQMNKYIPENSICVSCIATVGLVSISTQKCQTNQQINSIIPFFSYYLFYIFLYMRSYKDELIALASGGTATLNLNTSDFSEIEILTPPTNLLKMFDNKVRPIFNKIWKNQTQIRILEKLRDTLLPKLMSGEVRVRF